MSNKNKGPLQGMKVLDWTMWQFGPVSTMMLADLGAEVIKIESLDGDHGRQFGQVSGVGSNSYDNLSSHYFEVLNRQKLGIAVNLKSNAGRKIVLELVEQSDVFVENFRQGVAERLGLGWEDLSRINPKLIYGSATGYGPNGEDSGKPAFALTGEARSGSLWWGGPEDGVPYNLHGIADQIAGIMLSYGVLAGLIYREKHGAGQKVETSHLGSMMWLGMMRDGIGLLEGRELARQHRSNMNNPLWNTYRTKDGKWIALSMSQGERYWPIFCDVVNRKDLESNPNFISSEARQKYKSIVISELDEIFNNKTLDEWEKILRSSDLIWERVQSTLDLPSDQQVISNDYLVPFEHSVLGYSMWHQLPLTFGKTPVTTKKMAPSLGENTEEILIERLGYTWAEIEVLQDEGVIL